MKFYVDSGAGQCMCSIVDAFTEIRACAVVVCLEMFELVMSNYK